MIKEFLDGFLSSPKIAYPTILFGCGTIICMGGIGIMQAHEASLAIPWLIYGVIYFSTLTILSMWIQAD